MREQHTSFLWSCTVSPALTRVKSFCDRFGLRLPILLAPMAGASAPSLSIAVIRAGGLGACGALLMRPEEILAWADEVRTEGNGGVLKIRPLGAPEFPPVLLRFRACLRPHLKPSRLDRQCGVLIPPSCRAWS